MLKIDKLCCQRGRRSLFDRLSLELGQGQALYLTGVNGSGKSTLLALLADLLPPASGRIEWQGVDIRELGDDYRLNYLLLGQGRGFKPELTVAENIDFAFSLLGCPAPALSGSLWASLNIEPLAEMPFGQLSSGERARVELSPLLGVSSPLWLLDEPAAHLDEEAAAEIESLIVDHTEAGGIVICATHSLPRRRPRDSRFLHLTVEPCQ